MSLSADLAVAYDSTGAAWQRGPARVYDRLAELLVEACPLPFAGARVLDLGAGTGSASRAAAGRGADVVATDVAFGMLAVDAASRPPAAVGDAVALPFRSGRFDAVVAAFSLNHLLDPVAGLREAARVVRAGGAIVAGAYAHDDGHPVKDATAAAAMARGWRPAPWLAALRERAVPKLASVDRARQVARDAGFADATVEHVRVAFPELAPRDLVAWRLGMAQLAPFVATMSPSDVDALVADAIQRLGEAPVLERSVIVVSACVR